MLFEEDSSGRTRINQSAELESEGFFRLAGPLLERAIKRQFRNDLETLRTCWKRKASERCARARLQKPCLFLCSYFMPLYLPHPRSGV
jgi:hypothetical protein